MLTFSSIKLLKNAAGIFRNSLGYLRNFKFSESKKANQISGSLINSLNSEIEYEQKNYQTPTEMKTFLKSTGFVQLEKDESTKIVLSKIVNNLTVNIIYHSKEPPINGTEEDNEKIEDEKSKNKNIKEDEKSKGQSEENEEYQDDEDSLEFTVSIKNKNNSGLIFVCSTQRGEPVIQEISYHTNVDLALQPNYFDTNPDKYFGPDFSKLNTTLQEDFLKYLESFGISEKLCNYMEISSMDKEEKLYQKWLDDIKNFISYD